jgi:spore cortex biosynthesis protein YabQ
MTDYLYGLSLATQTKSFLLSLGLGFIMGFFYDLFRIIRLTISKKKVFIVVFDLLYCIFLCFVSFIFWMTVNEGQFRFYLLLGEAVGFAVYYFSLGVVIFTFGEKLVGVIKQCLIRFFRVLFFPFHWIFKRLKGVFDEFLKKGKKRSKKLKNKSKILLKVNKHLLYNHNVKKQNQVNDDI